MRGVYLVDEDVVNVFAGLGTVAAPERAETAAATARLFERTGDAGRGRRAGTRVSTT
jgi:hypothetical protein